MDAPYELLETLEPRIARVLAHNPSAFTYYDTQTYLFGNEEVAFVEHTAGSFVVKTHAGAPLIP